jgi:DNA-binding transcriptional LysR family regulator
VLNSRTPDLAALQMLVTVQELGSFSAAGAALALTQQAVSSRMRALEEQIGTPLLVRSSAGSTLTAAGALLAGWADEVLAAAERLNAGISSMRGENLRQLQVAASQTIAEHLVPQWLVTLRSLQGSAGVIPTVVELSVTNSAGVVSLVRAGKVSLGFIESPNLPSGLSHTTVGYDALSVVVTPTHRWAHRRKPLTADELAGTPLVTREVGSGTREALETSLKSQAPNLTMVAPVLELSTSAAVRSAISAGIAPGVLSTLAVRDDLRLGRLVIVSTPHLDLRRPLTAIWRKNTAALTAPARALMSIASGNARLLG